MGRESPSRAVAPFLVGVQPDRVIDVGDRIGEDRAPVLGPGLSPEADRGPGDRLAGGIDDPPVDGRRVLGADRQGDGPSAGVFGPERDEGRAREAVPGGQAQLGQGIDPAEREGAGRIGPRQHVLGTLRTAPDRLDLGAGDGPAVLADDRALHVDAPRQHDRREFQLGDPAQRHVLARVGRVGRREEGRGGPDRPTVGLSHLAGNPAGELPLAVGHGKTVAAVVTVQDHLHARDRPSRPVRAVLRTSPRTWIVSRRGIVTSVARPAWTTSFLGPTPRRGVAPGPAKSRSRVTIPAAMAGISNRPCSSQATTAEPVCPDPS